MSKFKGTPGPWYATTRQGSWDWVVAQSEAIEVCQMFHDGTPENETGEANARLVAAAPGLLKALERIAQYGEDHCGYVNAQIDGMSIATFARAALSRALTPEGE